HVAEVVRRRRQIRAVVEIEALDAAPPLRPGDEHPGAQAVAPPAGEVEHLVPAHREPRRQLRRGQVVPRTLRALKAQPRPAERRVNFGAGADSPHPYRPVRTYGFTRAAYTTLRTAVHNHFIAIASRRRIPSRSYCATPARRRSMWMLPRLRISGKSLCWSNTTTASGGRRRNGLLARHLDARLAWKTIRSGAAEGIHDAPPAESGTPSRTM